MRRIVARIVAGYDVVLKSSPGETEVPALGGQNAAAAGAASIGANSSPGLPEVAKAAVARSQIANKLMPRLP